MIVPDANLLLYAYDQSSRHHEISKEWWVECLSGRQPVGLCSVVIFAFIRIGTSSRAFQHPMSIAEAAGHVRSWLDRSVIEVLHVDQADIQQALTWLEEQGVGANLTTDAQIAAVAHRFGAVVHTADMDFQRFPVRSFNPLIR